MMNEQKETSANYTVAVGHPLLKCHSATAHEEDQLELLREGKTVAEFQNLL